MHSHHLAILRTGLATAVGLNSPATCAALRAKLTNPSETRFMGREGKWITGHQVPLPQAWQGCARLAQLAAIAIEEALQEQPLGAEASIPLLLCVAEPQRPGRLPELEQTLFLKLQQASQRRFAPSSVIVAQGRVSVATALLRARELIKAGASQVLIAAADSLLHGPSLQHYLREGRLLGPKNSNGFIPGEGAGALLVGAATGQIGLVCSGIGFGRETAHIDSGLPLRAEGLASAIKAALAEARCEMHEIDYRIADVSGEQYYFKEAALALARTLRQRKPEFDIWHPAECTGEVGALAGLTTLAWADAACRKGYSKGHAILAHMSNDDGRRAALALHFKGE